MFDDAIAILVACDAYKGAKGVNPTWPDLPKANL